LLPFTTETAFFVSYVAPHFLSVVIHYLSVALHTNQARLVYLFALAAEAIAQGVLSVFAITDHV